MSTHAEGRKRLHPDVDKVLTLFEELEVPNFYKTSPEQARATFRGLRPEQDVLPAIHRTESKKILMDGGEIELRIYYPGDSGNLPVLMWFHGGGWVFGDLDSGELACREIAKLANCVIVSVDYRLAPEFAFPTALEDCMRATKWVIENAVEIGVDVARLAVGGDSAGGNLAAAVAQRARDEEIELAHQLLVYPITQPGFDTSSYQSNAEGYFLSRESMMWFWEHYVPDHNLRDDPRVSPVNGDLNGLASAWIMTCAFDPLCDDGLMYAEALKKAGVAVETHHRDDAIHGVFGMLIDPGAESRNLAATSLRAAFSRS